MSIVEPEGQGEQAESWRTVRTIMIAIAIALGGYYVGDAMNTAKASVSKEASDGIMTVQERTDRYYVRKDGRELAELKASIHEMNMKVDMTNTKVDMLLRKAGLQIP